MDAAVDAAVLTELYGAGVRPEVHLWRDRVTTGSDYQSVAKSNFG